MSKVPRIRWDPNPRLYGDVSSPAVFYEPRYEGLLKSSSNYRLKNGSWSGGGAFVCYKDTWEIGTYPFSYMVAGATKGNIIIPAVAPSNSNLPPVPTVDSQLNGAISHYASGFRRTRPGNPVASAGQFLIELRDLPTLPLKLFSQLRNFRSLGSEYLNVQFGWIPFVSDVRKMYELYHTLDARIAQLVRENGKGIHRRTTLKDDISSSQTSTSSTNAFYGCRGVPAAFGPGASTSVWTQTTTTKEKVWYSAKYRYYVPDIGSSQWTRRAKLALFGALPTPELLWEVLPWSWLIDWFSNVGDVVSNASSNAVDNLTCQYSFIMRTVETETIDHVSVTWPSFSLPGNIKTVAGNATLFAIHKQISKTRAGGLNPFGLGVQVDSLSGYQLGILAALGISRGLVV
jgi:hypothetical protein